MDTVYTEISFGNMKETRQEVLIARFSDSADGFEQGDDGLKAWFTGDSFEQSGAKAYCDANAITYKLTELQKQNWNQVWESNFDPVVVDDFVMVRAHFHEPAKNAAHEIVITPKMSFGTGHHATTWLMMQQMRDINFTGKDVFDFGTGTGILAILAARLGSASVLAMDIDEWSIENAAENVQQNDAEGITLLLSGNAETGNRYDVIVANINKNVLLDTIPALSKQLKQDGILLLSGLLATDEQDIDNLSSGNNLSKQYSRLKDNWLCIKYKRC